MPTANGYQNEMQLRADSSGRSSLFGGSEDIQKSQGCVSCLCSHYLFKQVDGEPCFPKTLRIENCWVLERMLVFEWISLSILLSDSPCDMSSISSFTC